MAALTPDSSRSAPITIGLVSAAGPVAWQAVASSGSTATDATATTRMSLTENPFLGPGSGVSPLWTVRRWTVSAGPAGGRGREWRSHLANVVPRGSSALVTDGWYGPPRAYASHSYV